MNPDYCPHSRRPRTLAQKMRAKSVQARNASYDAMTAKINEAAEAGIFFIRVTDLPGHVADRLSDDGFTISDCVTPGKLVVSWHNAF